MAELVSLAVADLLGRPPFQFDHRKNYGLRIQIDWQEELGADRLVNAYAAYNKYREFCVVLDFGTATTFDVVSDEGAYLGGVIAPGLKGSAEALYSNTAKLPKVALVQPDKVIGKNTVDCLKSGIVIGYAEMVSGLIRRVKEELDRPIKVLATGGLATILQDPVADFDLVDENLTLWGLEHIYQHYLRND